MNMERCPACRARLEGASVCPRCTTDYSVTRRAEQQSAAMARLAVRQLAQGQRHQALASAEAACLLADSPLARAVNHTLQRSGQVLGTLPQALLTQDKARQ